jgi:hypothetical protein
VRNCSCSAMSRCTSLRIAKAGQRAVRGPSSDLKASDRPPTRPPPRSGTPAEQPRPPWGPAGRRRDRERPFAAPPTPSILASFVIRPHDAVGRRGGAKNSGVVCKATSKVTRCLRSGRGPAIRGETCRGWGAAPASKAGERATVAKEDGEGKRGGSGGFAHNFIISWQNKSQFFFSPGWEGQKNPCPLFRAEIQVSNSSNNKSQY